jgi:acetoacetyl-CoA synthetase
MALAASVPQAASAVAPEPIWVPHQQPSRIPINEYRDHVNKKFNKSLCNSHELQRWSVTSPHDFWIDLWSYVGLVPDLPPGTSRAYDPRVPMSEVPKFFEQATINYAENVLNQPEIDPSATALIGIRESGSLDGESWSWATLRENVRKLRSSLLRCGIKKGDRVAAVISTSPCSVGVFLAAASIGAIFTSIAPDLGEEVSKIPELTNCAAQTLKRIHRAAFLDYAK